MSAIASHLATIELLFAGSTTGLGEFFDCVLAKSSNGESISLLQQAQELGCVLTEEIEQQLTKTIAEVELSLGNLDDNAQHAETLRDALQLLHPDEAQRLPLLKQLHHRVLGLLYAVQAASQWPQPGELDQATKESLWVQALHHCGQHWDTAWPYPFSDSNHNHVPGNGLTEVGRVDAAMHHADKHDWLKRIAGQNWSRHCTTWLTVRRLLRFLLSEQDDKPTRKQSVPVLLVTRHDDRAQDDQSQGQVRGLALQLRNEGDTGWYLDPVTFGAAVFDQSLQLSFELAGRLSYSTFKGQPAAAIRLTPTTYPNIKTSAGQMFLVSGNSAGGLVGCGLYALAQRQELTEKLTASVGLTLKPGKDLTEGLLITAADIACTAVGGAVPKLISAANAGLLGVALHSQNKQDIDAFRKKPEAASFATQTADSFADLYEYLTQGYEADQVLREYAAQTYQRWADMLEGKPQADFDHKLDTHIEPRLSLELAPEEIQTRKSEDLLRERFAELPNGVDDLIGQYLLTDDKWLLISERAGGGKTVLSWQLTGELSRREEPFFVVRFENDWSRGQLRQALESELEPLCKHRAVSPTDVLNRLLEQRRVVLVFDALDQVDDETTKLLGELIHKKGDRLFSPEYLRVIVTSRPNSIERGPQGFAQPIWRHFHLEGFNDEQLNNYVDKAVERWEEKHPGSGTEARAHWEKLLEQHKDGELLRLPNNLRSIRQMIEEALEIGTSLRQFETAGDLAWELSWGNLERVFLKGTRALAKTQEEACWEAVKAAACLAFELFRTEDTYFISGTAITTVKDAARKRSGFDAATWQIADALLTEALSQGNAVLRRNNSHEFSFPSQKGMEFFVGLFLARFADEQALLDLQPQLGNKSWYNSWRYAIDMWQTTDSSGHRLAEADEFTRSLKALFRVPGAGHRRPCELMFRAWHLLMNQPGLVDIDQFLIPYRAQFRAKLLSNDLTTARLAAELVLEDDLPAFLEQACDDRLTEIALRLDDLPTGKFPTPAVKKERAPLEHEYQQLEQLDIEARCQLLKPQHTAYSLCSDATKPDRWRNEVDAATRQAEYTDTENLHFMMGAAPHDPEKGTQGDPHADRDEKPWQSVKIPAFYMATTCVTVGQYRLFDPQRVEAEKKEHDNIIPTDDCP